MKWGKQLSSIYLKIKMVFSDRLNYYLAGRGVSMMWQQWLKGLLIWDSFGSFFPKALYCNYHLGHLYKEIAREVITQNLPVMQFQLASKCLWTNPCWCQRIDLEWDFQLPARHSSVQKAHPWVLNLWVFSSHWKISMIL